MSDKITNHKSPITNVALSGVIVVATVRLLVAFRNVWDWQLDRKFVTDIGPIGTAICDGLCVVVLMLAVAGAMIGRGKTHCRWVLLWLLGAAGAMLHVWMGSGDVFIAGNWIGATALGLAAMIVAGASTMNRRMILAAVMALGVAIGLDAVWQVAVQHDRTVRNYLENKAKSLAENGITPGSIEQQKFETRLMQNEAIGAIGLSNVFGTVAGAITLLGAGWFMGVWKPEEEEGVPASRKPAQRRIRWAVGLCAMLGAVALACSFSKGAILAAGLVGAVFAIVAWWTGRPGAALRSAPAWWRNVAFVVVMLGVAAVVGRWWVLGIQTTPGGERSLLFRGFYWQAAAKMVQAEPIRGIGPGRFQDVYMVLKNPLSPEDVAQPHNVEVAWVSQLGLAGWAWVMLLLGMLWRAGGIGQEGRCASPAKREHAPRWELAIIAAGLGFGFQYYVQFPMLPEVAVLWVIGAVLFALMVGYAPAMQLNDRWLSIGALAAATVALLHSQIDMGLTNVSSMPVLLVVLGAAAGNGSEPGAKPARWPGALLLALIVALLVAWGVRVDHAAGLRAASVMRVRAYMRGNVALAGTAARGVTIIEPRVVNLMGNAALIMARRDAANQSSWLGRGYDNYQQAQGQPMHRAALARGEAEYDVLCWLLTQDQQWADRAKNVVARALAYDPRGTRTHVAMAELMEKLGERQAAAALYQMALKLDKDKYLDPDSQLSPDERKDLQMRIDRLR